MAVGKNITWEKGSNIIFLLILRLFEEYQEGMRGR